MSALAMAASQGRLVPRGPLTFATAREASREGLEAIRSAAGPEIEVDCGQVTESDSAGLAVLLQWLAAAKRRNLKMRFANLPERLRALAQISEIEGPLSLGGAEGAAQGA